ncbi:MAG: FtsX-like permease family protein [Salinivirgaceae bacterium]
MNILKLYYRNFVKNKSIHIITIGGFAISLALFILISGYVVHEKSFDRSYKNLASMYRIKADDNNAITPISFKDEIIDGVPEIDRICFYTRDEHQMFRLNNKKQDAVFMKATEAFFDVFSVDFLYGDKKSALSAKDNIVVTESFAVKYFGKPNPIGETIEMLNGEFKHVVAVIADPQKRTSLNYELIFNTDNEFFGSRYCNNNDCYSMYNTAMVLHPDADTSLVKEKLSAILKKCPYLNNGIVLQPFNEIYFDTASHDEHQHANVRFIQLLSVVAFIILLLSIVNYINLSVASNLNRFKEICIRKTSGAKVRDIVLQFLAESYISCLLALIVSFVLILLFSGFLSTLLQIEFNEMEILKRPVFIVSCFALLLVLGFIVGYLPAKMVSMFNPVQLFQRKSRNSKNSWWGAFNIFQFAISLFLIISLLVINKQIDFVKSKKLGYEANHLLRIELSGTLPDHAQAIKADLLAKTSIVNASLTTGNPLDLWMVGSGSFKVGGEDVNVSNVSQLPVDESFLKTFEIPLIMGRDFRSTDKNVCIINETFYKSLGWDNIESRNVWGANVIGVISDIHYEDLHKKIGNIQLQFNVDNNNQSFAALNVRIANTDIPETMKTIKSVFQEYDSEVDLNYQFYNDKVDQLYRQEEKQAKAISTFAFIAVFLSCLGLYGKIEFSSRSRIKEIGIRKVNGAKISEIIALLNKDFIQWVVIAFGISIPIAWYAMTKWLQNFAYKTELSWWIFALSGIIALGIAMLTVSWQSWKAASRNPVEALRYE